MAEENIAVNIEGSNHTQPQIGNVIDCTSDVSTDTDEMSKKKRFKRWFTNNFTNQRHEEAMKQKKLKRMRGQEHSYFNDVILQMLRRVHQTKTEEQIMNVFQQFDTNGDGVISEEELAEAMEQLLHMKLQEAEFQKFYEKLDANDDGMIQYKEFANWVIGNCS